MCYICMYVCMCVCECLCTMCVCVCVCVVVVSFRVLACRVVYLIQTSQSTPLISLRELLNYDGQEISSLGIEQVSFSHPARRSVTITKMLPALYKCFKLP